MISYISRLKNTSKQKEVTDSGFWNDFERAVFNGALEPLLQSECDKAALNARSGLNSSIWKEFD